VGGAIPRPARENRTGIWLADWERLAVPITPPTPSHCFLLSLEEFAQRRVTLTHLHL
jgi:hypothetical protein